MSTSSPFMDHLITTDDNFQMCDSPSGSSTSEPHDETIRQPTLVDQTFFYKLDHSSDNNGLLMQQNNMLYQQASPSLSPPLSFSSPHMSSFVDPLLPNNRNNLEDSNPNFWSGFNPLPNITKNFTEYMSGYSVQSPQQPQSFHNSPSSQTISDLKFKQESLPKNLNNNNKPGMQIRVLGVPQTGAKSRVETQIKLCIQLVTDDGDKAQWWSHLKLPDYMVAKDKLKRQILLSTAPNGTQIANVLDNGSNATIQPEKMLFLNARIVCASDPNKKVVTCLGCIQRERKRSQRRKENKLKIEDETEKMLEDEKKSLAAEEQKILLFNCSEVVDFSSGDTILPTRITCYCRHHNERLGFCIYFEMQDHTGQQVATGMSPPIMITDDHKSNKIKTSRKRPRTNDTLFSPFDKSAGSLAPFPTPQYPIQPRPPLRTSSLSPSPVLHEPIQEKPILQRLIPNEGPTYGGVEITLLGSGFRSGLTCMFGDVAASSTHFWSSNTLVCILPPAVEAGTVVVSFKEHPIDQNQDVTLFTYFNENDRALMELALQVVGLKMTGKVEDAREIAMRIVQGGNNNNSNQTTQHTSDTPQQQMSLEDQVIKIIQVMGTFRPILSSDVSMCTPQGHTLLHLASMLGFNRLSYVLIELGCDPNQMDRNGLTALHFAAWYNHSKVVSVLIELGQADPEISNKWNKKPIHLTKSTAIKYALTYLSSSEDESDPSSDSDVSAGLRRRHRSRTEKKYYAPTIQYLNDDESTSPSTDEIPDAEPIHDVQADSEDEDEALKEMNWMQRTLSHFQQPNDNSFIQNIKNNIPPTDLKTISDHLLQLPRPITSMFGADKSQKEPSDQALAWYMALAYAMGARSLDEEDKTPVEESSDRLPEVPAKRRDKRLFSFWVPLLCLMVIWLTFQILSSYPSVVDTIIGVSGFRRQYLSVH